MSEEQTDKRSASQKIEDLERNVVASFQTMDGMTRDIMVIKEAVKLLGNKVDSIVKALETNMPATINDEILTKIMIQNNVDELKEKVTGLVSQGILASQDSIDDSSFIVGREVNEAGEVVNPRLQFSLQALQEGMRPKLKGAKAGDVLTLEEGKLKLEVLEIYSVQPPKEFEQPSAPPVDAGSING